MTNQKRVIELLKAEEIIQDCVFQIEEEHINVYIECYHNIFGKTNTGLSKNQLSLARKIAGINLLKYNFEMGAKFSDMKAGIVYLIQNPCFPDHLKVGMTIDLPSRLNAYQVCDPYRRFSVFRYDFVLDRQHIEYRILNHPDAIKESGEWLDRDVAVKLFDMIIKKKFTSEA